LDFYSEHILTPWEVKKISKIAPASSTPKRYPAFGLLVGSKPHITYDMRTCGKTREDELIELVGLGFTVCLKEWRAWVKSSVTMGIPRFFGKELEKSGNYFPQLRR
jgi:hypothetical protein